MTIKPTPMEIETIFDAACQHFTDEAARFELDVVRHERFSAALLGHTGIAPQDRAEAIEMCSKLAARAGRLAEICRQMREKCHGHNLAGILSSLK